MADYVHAVTMALLNPQLLMVFGVSNCTVARYLLIFHLELHMVSMMGGCNTANGDITWEKREIESENVIHSKTSYKVPYLTTTRGNQMMPHGTFMRLVMTRHMLNTRSVKVILVRVLRLKCHKEKCPALHNTPKKRTKIKRPKLQQPSVIVPDLLSLVSDNSSLPQAMLLKSTIHKTKSSVWWLCVVQLILDCVKLPANLCLCQPAQQLLNVCSQTLVSYTDTDQIEK